MPEMRLVRYVLIFLVLCLGVVWSLTSVEPSEAQPSKAYPNAEFLCTGQWLRDNLQDNGLVVVDVRADKHFDNTLIPGAIRLPWSEFRRTDRALGIADEFVGLDRAQEILGEHGITRASKVVLYDSVARDGGATASYVFWVLDLLGHEDKMILERGIDGWKDAGGETVRQPDTLGSVVYQVPVRDMRLERKVRGDFISDRLGDRYYQILDVRSPGEYSGELANTDLKGNPLKRGHIPTAVNIEYALNWTDEQSKDIKSYAQLQELYRGVNPDRAVIPYCHSARRGSFSYFILRLMGFSDVRLYARSWNEWGQEELFFPGETAQRQIKGKDIPQGGKESRSEQAAERQPTKPRPEESSESGGYVSCGG
ncbi:MAG: rhodanese-like domain-containing protein [Desulfovermiculus sp.]